MLPFPEPHVACEFHPEQEVANSMMAGGNAHAAYAIAFKQWHGITDDKHHKSVSASSKEIASKLAYHWWPTHKIVNTIVKREHFLPKMFKRVPPLTRFQRWSIVCTAMQTAFFWQTFLFSASCVAVPKPARCPKKKPPWYAMFIPTWNTFFGSIFGIICAVPVPLTLTLLHRKRPVMEILTEEEKKRQLRRWRIEEAIGWFLVVVLNAFYVYWLTIFTNYYSWPIVQKWVNAGGMSLVHRFFTSPVLRASLFALVSFVSTHTSVCDFVLGLYPNIMPVEQLQALTPEQVKALQEKDDEADDTGAMDMD